MNEHILVDDFGRRTVFTGERLVEESTDNSHSIKPQWIEIDVWRTQAGSFVVQRTTRYRIRHLNPACSKAEGYDLAAATPEDTYACRTCNPSGINHGGWSQEDRTTIDVYHTAEELIDGFQIEGKFTTLSRAILADIAEQDNRVDEAWSTVVVP